MHGLGIHLGAWMARDGDVTDYVSPELYLDLARTAERGKLHAVFLAEQITNQENGVDRPCGTLDAITVLATMAAATERVGLIGTASTTYNEPYELARRFATLDHLSAGRAGWNSIATQNPHTAEQFGSTRHPDHGDRYGRAEEFLEVVEKLWDSWAADALVGDKVARIFGDPTKVHEINHVGENFSVRGPLPFARCPQGRPVIFQAGSSELGRAQAATHADAVFTAAHLLEDAIAFRDDMRTRAERAGRPADQIKILPGLSIILGDTEENAWARKRSLEEALGLGPNLAKLARRVGVSLEVLQANPDRPFPIDQLVPESEFSGSIGFRRSIVNLAVTERLTTRELSMRYGGGHQEVIGTPEQVADTMQRQFEAGGADGFTLMIDMLPSGLHDVVDLLVPELQRRGLFHEDYQHDTLRGELGLDPVGPRTAVPA
ncbi:NtaA/DmoA family FMN-dependent monooxygenase [Pseudonocardia endophytica]|nr:NtaA/DmoA family FMN-dependent monooxygenase [Pseudonocardia endophytica]